LALAGCDEPDKRQPAPPPRAAASARTPDRCQHRLPPTLCTKCNPALAAVFQAKGDWCSEHGFPESFCPICNPDAAVPDVVTQPAASVDWCSAHALPESKCTRCNPGLVPKFKEAGDWCEAHGFPESACPVCNPQKAPAGAERAAIEARVVRSRAPSIENAAGIATVPAREAQASPTIECTARIEFDADRVADVRALVPGIVRNVKIELGARVQRGVPLFHLESTRVSEIQGALQAAQQRVRTAEANQGRQKILLDNQITSQRQLEHAEQELTSAKAEARTAQATLRLAGAAQSAPSGRYTLSAPIAGTVVRRPAVLGLLATESESLATIADTSVMWALCDVREADASRVALGQKVLVTAGGASEAPLEGEVAWIAA